MRTSGTRFASKSGFCGQELCPVTLTETRCKSCNAPLVQAARRGPHPREYCNDTCRQRAKRARDEREAREQQQAEMRARWEGYPPEVQQALEDVMNLHSAELAEQVASAINAGGSQHVEVYQEKLAACANRIEKLERQVEIQKERLGQYYQSNGTQSARIAELEQEITRYRDLHERVKLEGRFMALGELLQYRALLMIPVMGSISYWKGFMERATDEELAKAVDAAEAFHENLTAPRLEHQAKRIAELEAENRQLQERLNVEARYLMDTEPRHLKAWLRKRTFPGGSFAQRFLADTRFKPQASRATYEQQLSAWGYSADDRAMFRDVWKAMLLQS